MSMCAIGSLTDDQINDAKEAIARYDIYAVNRPAVITPLEDFYMADSVLAAALSVDIHSSAFIRLRPRLRNNDVNNVLSSIAASIARRLDARHIIIKREDLDCRCVSALFGAFSAVEARQQAHHRSRILLRQIARQNPWAAAFVIEDDNSISTIQLDEIVIDSLVH